METLFSSISRIWQPTWTSFKCSAPLHGKRWLALREERKHNMKVFSKKNLTKLKRVNKNTANSQPLGVDHLACFSFLSLLLPASWLLHCSLVPLGERMCVEGQIGEGRDHQSILHLASHSTERLGWNRRKQWGLGIICDFQRPLFLHYYENSAVGCRLTLIYS